MFLSEFIDLLSSRNAAFLESESLMQLLIRLNQAWTDYEKTLIGMAEPASKDATAHLLNVIIAAKSILKEFSIRDLFREIDALKECLQPGAQDEQDDSEPSASSLLETLSDRLDSYARSPSQALALSILTRARDLHGKIVVYSQVNTELIGLLASSEAQAAEGEGELSILFPSANDYKSVLACLEAIFAIYSESCTLLEVSASTHPIRIRKIESGSLWVKLFGEPGVLAFMSAFLKASAKYAYRNYTAEGRASVIPKKIEVIEEFFRLSDQLKHRGIDTTQMDEGLQRAAVTLVGQFNSLIEGQQSISINNEEISPVSELERLLSGDADKPRLPGASSKRLKPSRE